MSKFRIVAGARLVRRTKAVLQTVLELPELRVEVGERAVQATSADGKKVFLFGSLIGRRDAAGRIHTLENLQAFVGSLADSTEPAAWNRYFEGDAVMLVVASDGSATLVGDRFFKRDVYIQEGADGTTLCSDLSLTADNPARDGYDSAALAHTLTYYGYRPPKRHTMYRSVRRLGVGDIAVLQAGKLQIERTPFAPVPFDDYADNALDQYADAFLDYIEAAGSPVGNTVFLSSGWDSSSILAALVKVFGRKRVTAIVGKMFYSERSGNCNRFEIERAGKFAEHFGVNLQMVDLDYVNKEPEWMPQVRENFRAHNVQSLTGLNHARLAHGAAQMAAGRPLFAGETSDGAHNLGFSQYVTVFHPTQAFREYSDKMASYLFGPTFARELVEGRHAEDAVYRFFRERSADALFDEVAPRGEDRMRQLLVSFFLRNGRMPLWSGRNVQMLTQDGIERYTEEMAGEYLEGEQEVTPDTLYSWYLHLYNSFHWQGSTVSTVQKMGDLFGLPAHNPYWASGVQEFLSSMPESWGRGLELVPTKYPLKRMMREKLEFPMHLQVGPHSYTYDVDPTFNHGFELMHHSQLGQHARESLASKPYHQVLSSDWFNLSYIDGLVDKFVRGEEQHGTALNDLISVWLLCQSGWYE